MEELATFFAELGLYLKDDEQYHYDICDMCDKPYVQREQYRGFELRDCHNCGHAEVLDD